MPDGTAHTVRSQFHFSTLVGKNSTAPALATSSLVLDIHGNVLLFENREFH